MAPSNLPAAVVGDDHALHPVIDRLFGHHRVQDALHKIGKRVCLAQEGQVGPGQARVGDHLKEVADGRQRVLLRRHRQGGTEHGVAEVVGQSLAEQKGQPAQLQSRSRQPSR